MPHTTRESARSLALLAHAQGGYFTANQVQDPGYEYSQLAYHVSSGNFDRVEHGLYRLPSVPPSEHDELIRLSLWSRSQKDEPQAVVSHQSALVLHDLSELLPVPFWLVGQCEESHLRPGTVFEARKSHGSSAILRGIGCIQAGATARFF